MGEKKKGRIGGCYGSSSRGKTTWGVTKILLRLVLAFRACGTICGFAVPGGKQRWSYTNFGAVGFVVSCCGSICGFGVSVATNIFDWYRSMSDAARRIEEDVTARALLATVDRDNEREARELKDDEMARSLLAEADGNNQMYKTVKVSSPHIKRVNTVALKFEAFVSKVERVVIERYPNIPRKWENGVENKNKVEPWPSSGMFLPLVEMYMTQYVKNVKPKLGYTVPGKRTVQNQEDVVYIAALARCKFTADEQGTAERQKTKMRAYGRLSSGQQKKDMSSFVKKMILTLGPVFQFFMSQISLRFK